MKNELNLLEFIFTSSEKKFYNLMLYGSEDTVVLNKKEKLEFFENAQAALTIINLKRKKKFKMPVEISLTCNVPRAIKLTSEKIDNYTLILNCFNTLDDLLISLNLKIPPFYRKSLWLFADHLTFSRNINIFFNKTKYSREFIIKGILKMEEIILANSQFIFRKREFCWI